MTRKLLYTTALCLCVVTPIPAQDDADSDAGGPLVRFLENTLSNEDRQIEVRGLSGALSARATIEEIIVSDDQGPWFTLRGAVLDWNRLALVRGRFSVNELTADQIEILRRPEPPANPPPPDLPSPEAQPFALPELPVAIQISQLSIGEIDLAEPVVGTAATLSVNGRLNLASGTLDTLLSVARLDRAGDALTLQAGFSNETRIIDLDVTLTEAEGGLLATALRMPGEPALAFTARGNGPVRDFTADIGLATEGVRRFGGTVALAGQPAADGGEAEAVGFTADLSGDVTPLMEAAFHPFFGDDTAIALAGVRQPSGALSIDTFSIGSQALNLTGNLALSDSGAPVSARLDGTLAAQDGSERLVLPVAGADTSIRGARVDGTLDAAGDGRWTLDLLVDGFENPGARVDEISLTGDGTITLGDTTQAGGALAAAIEGLALPDATLSETVGEALAFEGRFDLPGDGTLGLEDIRIDGAGLAATASAEINGLGAGFALDGRAQVDVADLSRFSALTGQDLSGALSAQLTGNGTPLGGTFDVMLNGTAQDVTTGIAQADALLAGRTALTLDVERNQSGIDLRSFEVANPQLDATGSGAVRTAGTELAFSANLTDMGLVVPQFPGPASLSVDVAERQRVWSGDLRFDGPDAMFADASGNVSLAGDADVTLSAELPNLERLVPQLVGTARLSGDIARNADTGVADATLRLDGPDLFADIAGNVDRDGMAALTVAAELAKLEAFVPQLPGAGRVNADITGDVNAQSGQGRIRVDGPDALFADVEGTLALAGPTDLTISAELPRLEAFVPQLPGAVSLTGSLDRPDAASNWVAALDIAAPQDIAADLNAMLAPDGAADIDLAAALPRLETFVPQLEGQATLSVAANRDGGSETWAARVGLHAPQDIRADITGTADPAGALDVRLLADVPQLQSFVPQLDGPARLTGDVQRDTDGMWNAVTRLTAPAGIAADIQTRADETGPIDARYSASVPELGLLVPQLPGPAQLSGTVARDDSAQVWSGRLDLSGPEAIRATVDGRFDITGPAEGRVDVTFPELERVVPQLFGTATVNGEVSRADADSQWVGLARIAAPQGISAAVDGAVDPDGAVQVTFDTAIAQLETFVPQFPGAASLSGDVSRAANGQDWTGKTRFEAAGDVFADFAGTLTEGGNADLTFDAEVPGMERVVPDFPGTLTANGTAKRASSRWTIDAQTAAPGGTEARIAGTFDETTGTADITANGGLQLGAANAFVAPITVQGDANFNLALRGAPGLESLSGQITTSDTAVAIPQIQNAITGFGGTVDIANGGARLAFAGDMRTGGGFRIDGPVSLAAPFDGTIDIALLGLILTDNISYETTLGGGLRIAGPLAGAASISGQIDVGETNLNIATAGGAPGAAPIPVIEHLNERPDAFLTRKRAGLVVEEREERSGPSGPPIGLDVVISAPNRIFVRGRGVDAELGGRLRIRGTTTDIRPEGGIELIRGHFQILTRRLDLTRGQVTLQGSLEPDIDFAAETTTSEGTATLTIQGPVSAPQIEVTSDPERPSEEAFAMLVFGDQFTNLSPVKIAQLAASLNQLRGGGGGLTEGIRQGLGVSSVDFTTDDEGNAAVGVGTYLSDNVYTDVTVDARGESEVNINLDVTDNFKVKGSVDNDSNTSVGVFFERDY